MSFTMLPNAYAGIAEVKIFLHWIILSPQNISGYVFTLKLSLTLMKTSHKKAVNVFKGDR